MFVNYTSNDMGESEQIELDYTNQRTDPKYTVEKIFENYDFMVDV